MSHIAFGVDRDQIENEAGITTADAIQTLRLSIEEMSRQVHAQTWYKGAVQQGVFTTLPHDAAHFTANGSMTWTVASGDQNTLKYCWVEESCTISFDFLNTTVGGTLDSQLILDISDITGNADIAHTVRVPVVVYDNGTHKHGICTATVGETTLVFTLADGSDWTAATDATDIHGQITLEIN